MAKDYVETILDNELEDLEGRFEIATDKEKEELIERLKKIVDVRNSNASRVRADRDARFNRIINSVKTGGTLTLGGATLIGACALERSGSIVSKVANKALNMFLVALPKIF